MAKANSRKPRERQVRAATLLGLVICASPAVAQISPASTAPAKGVEASMALQRGDVDQSIRLFTASLDDATLSNDRRAVLLTERGVAYMKRQNPKAALDDFNKAASIYPEYAALYVNRGNLLLSLGHAPDTIKEAIKDFDRAIVLSPALAAAFGNRGAAHLKLGAADAAIADFTRAIELQPQNPAALNGRGRARLMANRTHGAIRDFTRAVTINPGFAQSYRNRAEAYMRFGQYAEAAEDLSRALAFDARRIEDYAARGRAYLAANNPTSALTDFAKVVELDPKSIEGRIGLGAAKARAEAFDDALAELSRVIEMDPRSARAYAVRAWIYKRGQQPDLGEKDVERALRLEPVKADAFWAQGELKEAAGDRDGAVAAYSRALGLNINHRETLEALSRLGLEPQRDETVIEGAGLEAWKVTAVGDQFIATHPQFPALRVPLEMMGAGQPKITLWERQKPPNAGFGILQYTSGTLPLGQGNELVETAAVIDLSAMAVIAMPTAKIGAKTAAYSWNDTRLAITGADGLAETIVLRQKSDGREAVVTATRRVDPASQGSASAKSSGGPPAWAPWAQGKDSGPTQKEAATRHTPPPRKPKTIFDLIFGN